MKKNIKILVKSFLIILILELFLSFILTIIKYKTDTSIKTINTIGLIISSLIFLFGSIVNGKLNKKRGLINGIIMSSVYSIIILIFKLINLPIITSSFIIKIILIIIGNVIGVNL